MATNVCKVIAQSKATTALGTVDDPSDWPASFEELRRLDSLLRCSICYEFFNIAMMVTHCSHNYCSLCIREHLTHQMQCPSCSCGMKESDLKGNRVLDELVNCFRAVRQRLLAAVNQTLLSKKKEIITPMKTMEHSEDAFEDDSERHDLVTTPQRHVRTEGSAKKRRRIDTESYKDSEDEFVYTKTTPGPDTRKSTLAVDDQDQEKDKVPCPVCGKAVASSNINSHPDLCLNKEERPKRNKKNVSKLDINNAEKKESSSQRRRKCSSPRESKSAPVFEESNNKAEKTFHRSGSNQFITTKVSKRNPLPKELYNTLTAKQLRSKLKGYNLSTKGDLEEIIRQVHLLEAQQTKLKAKPTLIHTFDRTKTEEEKQKSTENYLKKHNNHFEELIKQIREGKLKQQSSTMTSASADVNDPENDCSKSSSEDSVQSEGITFNASEPKITHESTESDTTLKPTEYKALEDTSSNRPYVPSIVNVIDVDDSSDDGTFLTSPFSKVAKTSKSFPKLNSRPKSESQSFAKKKLASSSSSKGATSGKSKLKGQTSHRTSSIRSKTSIGSYFSKAKDNIGSKQASQIMEPGVEDITSNDSYISGVDVSPRICSTTGNSNTISKPTNIDISQNDLNQDVRQTPTKKSCSSLPSPPSSPRFDLFDCD